MKLLNSLLIALLLTTLVACTNYYKVTDTTSGKSYYTTDIDERRGGAVSFEDAKTSSEVTLQNSEVIEVSKQTYKEAVEGP